MYKITLGVDGMACGMCESHVNNAIRDKFNVKKVNSSAKKNQTEIIAEEQIGEDELIAALAPTGYGVTSYQCETYKKKGLFSFGK